MSLVAAVLTAGLAASTIGPPPVGTLRNALAGPPRVCDPAQLQQAAGFEPSALRRLDQLPAGSLQMAVVKTVAGCSVTVVRHEGRSYWILPPNPQAERREITPLGSAGAAAE